MHAVKLGWVAVQSLAGVRGCWLKKAYFYIWLLQYSERFKHVPRGTVADLMLKTNPKYVLRNHLGEEAIRAAKLKDFPVVRDLLAVLEIPFDEHPSFEAWAGFPPDWASGIEICRSS